MALRALRRHDPSFPRTARANVLEFGRTRKLPIRIFPARFACGHSPPVLPPPHRSVAGVPLGSVRGHGPGLLLPAVIPTMFDSSSGDHMHEHSASPGHKIVNRGRAVPRPVCAALALAL